MLAIAIAATRGYLHAWPQCLRSISAAASHHAQAHFIFATDDSPEAHAAKECAAAELPSGWQVTAIHLPGITDDRKDYAHAAQLRIAALQGAAFAHARAKVRADLLWSVESDNLVPANALRVLEWTLAMPTADGTPYYDVAAATYPNGLFLGGFGTRQHPIAEDFLPHERTLPARLARCLAACQERLKSQPTEREHRRHARLQARVRKCPPQGNIWEVIAKHGWRRRGWMDFAYPGIGEGAVVPTDWCGLGCTLMSRRALAHADFHGYDGGGTQDLFLCWHRWHPAGLRIACVPHIACDHIKPDPAHPGAFVHHRAYHEPEPAQRGHLRVHTQPWVRV